MLRLIQDMGVDLFDVGLAMHAASLGVALDFVFPVFASDAGYARQSLGHNLHEGRTDMLNRPLQKKMHRNSFFVRWRRDWTGVQTGKCLPSKLSMTFPRMLPIPARPLILVFGCSPQIFHTSHSYYHSRMSTIITYFVPSHQHGQATIEVSPESRLFVILEHFSKWLLPEERGLGHDVAVAYLPKVP